MFVEFNKFSEKNSAIKRIRLDDLLCDNLMSYHSTTKGLVTVIISEPTLIHDSLIIRLSLDSANSIKVHLIQGKLYKVYAFNTFAKLSDFI